MGPIGNIGEYRPDLTPIQVYIERFELFLEANSIEEGKRVHTFLTVMGEKAYTTLRNVLAPQLPTKAKYEDLVDTLLQHYGPKRSVVAERYHFHRRIQGKDETLSDFIVALKELAATCNFGNFLEDALRDRFIAGLHNNDIRCRLLAIDDKNATFKKACSTALSMEAADKETRQMKQDGKKTHQQQRQLLPSTGTTSHVLNRKEVRRIAERTLTFV